MATLIGAVLAACLTGCSTAGAGVSATSPAPSTPAPAPPPTAVVDVPVAPAQVAPAAAPVAPTRLVIDSLGVDMPVTDVGVESSGQMQLPVDPAVAGWYRYGPDAAATAGHIVLAAHVDAVDYPIGPLANLRDVAVGSPVVVTAADGSARTWTVESLTYYEKAALPTAELFAREGDPALVIITCGGPFDSTTGHYRDNVVAIARPQS
ncbi:class F sortase [Microbacterium sp. 4R-513]|uniref:class F sortase n=1 Tax=Microbacterium sp. 4R-513 TaxID=2567934 RepID=UPI0013E15505|nr:class F sortase [Microbacterium sp. 4R-513]QIG39362.1 class F sortase [Microbacterium sp. 4R-513]